MGKLFRSSLLWGVLLILAGGALLFQNFYDIPAINVLWALVMGLFGIGFLYLAWKESGQWWRWLVGAGLIGLAMSALLEIALPEVADWLDGAAFLLCLAAGFALIYLAQRTNWWAVIPAGVLATLGVVSLMENSGIGLESGSVFFTGLGLTFVLVGLLPGAGQRWGFIPGGLLLILGLLLAFQAGFVFDIIWPVGLIIGGGYLIFRALRSAPG